MSFTDEQALAYKRHKLREAERCEACPNGKSQRQVPEATRNHLLDRQKVCRNCGSMSLLEVDHYVPKSRGGCSCAPNLQVLCRECNASKSDLLMSEWVLTGLWLGRTPKQYQADLDALDEPILLTESEYLDHLMYGGFLA